MAFTNNKFCWHGVISTDVDAANAFYPEVLGWKSKVQPMGDTDATFFEINGKIGLHLREPPMEGVPSHWDNYLRVTDVDATAKLAVKNGGKQLVPGTDIAPGRFSVVAAPSGATFTLFHEADEATSENAEAGVGGIHWTELHSTDLDADLSWLKKTFALKTEEMDMPDGPYFILKDGETQVGGAMKAMNPETPSMWLTWVHVDDVDATLKRVTNHGGKAHSELMDVPNIGRMAVVADPTGGVFGIITPASA